MTRSRRGLALTVALLGLAAFATAADAKVKRRHAVPPPPYHGAGESREFQPYRSSGSDRNPGGDNLYFSDTKRPSYIVGPAWFQRWD